MAELENSPQLRREKALEPLKRSGGFNRVVQPLFDERLISYFSPDADDENKQMFLEEMDFQQDRKKLKAGLKLLIGLISDASSPEEVVGNASRKMEEVEQLRNKNLATVVKESEELERTYRELNAFFSNAGGGDVENIVFLNVDGEALKDPDDPMVPEKVQAILSDPALRIDQDKVFSFLVIPGFVGEDLIQRYTNIAHKSKVLLMTDYKDFKSVKDILNYRNGPKGQRIGGAGIEWSHATVFANHVCLREKHAGLGEKDDLYGSPSLAIAGGIYNLDSNIAQPFAGYLKGGIKGVQGLRIKDVNQPQVSALSDVGLNGLVDAYQTLMAFEARTLFEGSNTELIQYAVVRTFDYIDKSLKHFLNQNILSVMDRRSADMIRQKILDFLRELSENNIIKRGVITNFKPDRNQPDLIHIDFEIMPLWVTRTFVYKLDVSRNNNAESEIEE
jgi:hypothetical protein